MGLVGRFQGADVWIDLMNLLKFKHVRASMNYVGTKKSVIAQSRLF